MTRVRVYSRLALRRAILSLRPSQPDYYNFREVVKNHVLNEVAQRQWRSFNDRRLHGADEFGNDWALLSQPWIRHKGHDRIGEYKKRLMESLEPGIFTGDRYFATNPEQIAEIGAQSFRFGTTVPHAKYFDHRRPIFPQDIRRWVRDGIRKGMERVSRLMGGVR